MSLDWSVKDVADWETVCRIEAPEDEPMHGISKGDLLWNPVTTALVWATIDVGLGRITAENAGEFFARLRHQELLFGAKLVRAVDENGERPEGTAAMITPAEVLAHVGLSTNVADESRSRWLKRMGEYALDEQRRAFERAIPVTA